MDEHTKALIAIGASAAVNCHSCVDHHLAHCDQLGIARDEVKAAIETGMMVNRGAAARTRTHVSTVLGIEDTPKGGSGGCGCG